MGTNKLDNFIVSSKISVREAIARIEATGKKTVIVVNKNKEVIGIFTDGDMRRYILKNGDLNLSISNAMNPKPIVFRENQYMEIQKQMKERALLIYPIIDSQNKLVDIVYWNDKDLKIHPSQELPKEVNVIIMAGGKGTRLYPYTKILPKPLIPVGDEPILTHVINSFRKYNCKDFTLILNHKSDMIKSYYSDINKDYMLNYKVENNFLGTAGGLSMLKGKVKNTCFVSNCDILVNADFSCIYKWHKQEENLITIISALREIKIPYGVINFKESGEILNIEEKPIFPVLINVGVYLIEPEVIDNLNGQYIHMTDLAKNYIDKNKKVGVFPIAPGDWLDMGQFDEYNNMQKKINENFC